MFNAEGASLINLDDIAIVCSGGRSKRLRREQLRDLDADQAKEVLECGVSLLDTQELQEHLKSLEVSH